MSLLTLAALGILKARRAGLLFWNGFAMVHPYISVRASSSSVKLFIGELLECWVASG